MFREGDWTIKQDQVMSSKGDRTFDSTRIHDFVRSCIAYFI